MEVWGGSQLTARGVQLGGLDAWVYSKPYGQAPRGGDVYYASSCATGRITRLLLADVAGHGSAVASTAADLRVLMRRFVNCLDQTEFVRRLNRQFAELPRKGAFATAIVTTFFSPTKRLTVCNAGHPRPLRYRASEDRWEFLCQQEEAPCKTLRNIPLGLIHAADYDQFDIELDPGDYLLAYSDALIESRDADGEMLGEEGLLRIVRLLGSVPAERLIETLLAEIADRYQENLSADDVTVIVVKATGGQLRHGFRHRLRAGIRLLGSLARAANPKAERPPLPDFRLANIGGAILPALERLWRAQVPPRPARDRGASASGRDRPQSR